MWRAAGPLPRHSLIEKEAPGAMTRWADGSPGREGITTMGSGTVGCSGDRVGRPNESRLSCGAELESSQMKFYHTAWRTFSGCIEDGRRQLQALVRRRALRRLRNIPPR